jgi:hypothetical protein
MQFLDYLAVFANTRSAIVASLIRMIWVVRDSHVALAFLNIDSKFLPCLQYNFTD